MIRQFLFVIVFFSSFISAQSDWVRWESKQVSYEIPDNKSRNDLLYSSGLGINIISGIRNIYKFLISDLDGDNCPFYPSCSAFFVEAVKETNILKGTLMFADRFTRDINFFKGTENYPIHISGKYYDPVYNYSMNPLKIKFLPSSSIAE